MPRHRRYPWRKGNRLGRRLTVDGGCLILKIADLLTFAQKIELNHAQFYRQAAQGAELPRSKRLLVTLANKEEVHAIRFADMAADFAEESIAPNQSQDCDQESLRQLDEIIAGQIFSQAANPSKYLSGKETTHEILQIAIDAENQTAEFYTMIGMTLADNAAKDKVEEILEEERSHVTFLIAVRGQLHK